MTQSYPYISISKALDMVWAIYQKEQTNPARREDLALEIGYGSLNGSSDSALTTMVNYGFLEELEDRQLKVTNVAVEILESQPGDPKRLEAIQEAVSRIEVFEDIKDEYSGYRMVPERSLYDHLQSRGLGHRTALRTAKVYRATIDFITREKHPNSQNHRKLHGDGIQAYPEPGTRSPAPSSVFDQWKYTFGLDEGMEAYVEFRPRRTDEYAGRLTSQRIGTLIALLTIMKESFDRTPQK